MRSMAVSRPTGALHRGVLQHPRVREREDCEQERKPSMLNAFDSTREIVFNFFIESKCFDQDLKKKS